MVTVLNLFEFLIAVGILFVVMRIILRTYQRYRGKMLIPCPENKKAAVVEVDAWHAIVTAVTGKGKLRLKDCSRWPDREGCVQACLQQIQRAPEECLVRTILEKWFQGKTCVFCSKPMTDFHWLDHKPALLGPDRKTLDWNKMAIETLPDILQSHQPVCFDCHVAETFRRLHPDMFVDRPSTSRS